MVSRLHTTTDIPLRFYAISVTVGDRSAKAVSQVYQGLSSVNIVVNFAAIVE